MVESEATKNRWCKRVEVREQKGISTKVENLKSQQAEFLYPNQKRNVRKGVGGKRNVDAEVRNCRSSKIREVKFSISDS